MTDNHDQLRRLSTRGTARGADDVLAAAERGAARRRSLTRMAFAGTAVVVIALGIVVSRPTSTDDDTEIGPASDEAISPTPTPSALEPEPLVQPTPTPDGGENGESPPVLLEPSDPRCGQDQDLPVPDSTATAEAAAAFDGWLNTIPREDAAPFVQDWDSIGRAILAAAERAPLPLDQYHGEVGELVGFGPELRCFDYSILNDDVPVYSAIGAAILLDDGWVVTRETVCAAVEIGTVDCPLTQAEEDAGQCPSLHGAEPWLTLFSEDPYWTCRRVAEFQQIHVWNKGFAPILTIDWPTGVIELQSDTFIVSEPAGDIFEPGPNEITGTPYPVPTIWLVPREDSPISGWTVGDGSFGAMEVGMTLDEASEALAAMRGPIHPVPVPRFVIDPGLAPGPTMSAAVFEGDPYSPIILVEGPGDGSSVIVEIISMEDW